MSESNSKQGRDIVENAPQYRSVAMMGALSTEPQVGSSVVTGLAPLPLQTPSNDFSKNSNGSSQLTTQICKNPPTANTWNVAELPSLPAAHFLERTSAHIEGNAQDIANRICDYLRSQSIAARCDEEEQNLLVAETFDYALFAVRLFGDKDKTVVEIQRKCGCCYQFRQVAKSVLNAAQGIKTAPSIKRSFAIAISIPRLSPQQEAQQIEDCFKVACSQLESNFLESQLIGMESLEQLVKSRTNGLTIAAKHVLGDCCIEKLLLCTKLDVRNSRTNVERRHNIMMKRRALYVLANALCALAESNQLAGFLQARPDISSDTFMSSLIVTLAESSRFPHEATQAARCILALTTVNKVKDFFAMKDIDAIVSSACSLGGQRSALLEAEATKLQQHLCTFYN